MSVNPTISEADCILDELEQLARNSQSDSEFWQQFLKSLCALLRAKSAAVVLRIQSQSAVVARFGTVSSEHVESWQRSNSPSFGFVARFGEVGPEGWMAVPLHLHDAETGCLMALFAAPIPDSSRLGLEALLLAFSEIGSLRGSLQRDRRLRETWEIMHHGVRQLAMVDSLSKLRGSLVDQVMAACDAVRASLAIVDPKHGNRPRLVTTSGVGEVDSTSPTVKALEALVAEAIIDGKPILSVVDPSTHDDADSNRDCKRTDGVFENHLVIGWDQRPSKAHTSWLIMEWDNRESMTRALPSVPQILPFYHSVWGQQSRWCSLPAWIRRRWNGSTGYPFLHGAGGLLKRGVILGILAGLVWGALRPYPMVIESTGILEPISKRYIHASADGYLVELFVNDGERVSLGQKLARLRSPSLELQVEEVHGQIRAIVEKRNGLRVAINQLSPTSPESLAAQTRISTELLLLDTQEKHAREKLEFLKKERDRLLLASPIDGVVVARELPKELENRPLKRGDSLFQVVDLEGDWRLRIDVADRDSGYVDAFYGKALGGGIEYVFDSLPNERFRGSVSELANVVENRQGYGSFRTVFAGVDREAAARAHMGATAQVSFACGEQPFWFVWSRPLIELVQKRFRWFSQLQPSSSEQNEVNQ